MKLLSFQQPPVVSIADYATAPIPSIGPGAVVWSPATTALMRWDGTFWRVMHSNPMLAVLTSELTQSTANVDMTAASLTIPANALTASSAFQCTMMGTVLATTTTGSTNIQPYLKLGTVKLASFAPLTGSAPTVNTVYGFTCSFVLQMRTVGATGTCYAGGSGFFQFVPVVTLVTSNKTASAISTTVSNILSIGVQEASVITTTIETATIIQIV